MKTKEFIEKLEELEEVVDKNNKRIADLEAKIKKQEKLLLNHLSEYEYNAIRFITDNIWSL